MMQWRSQLSKRDVVPNCIRASLNSYPLTGCCCTYGPFSSEVSYISCQILFLLFRRFFVMFSPTFSFYVSSFLSLACPCVLSTDSLSCWRIRLRFIWRHCWMNQQLRQLSFAFFFGNVFNEIFSTTAFSDLVLTFIVIDFKLPIQSLNNFMYRLSRTSYINSYVEKKQLVFCLLFKSLLWIEK